MFDFELLMRYKRACRGFRPEANSYDSETVLAQLRALGEAWRSNHLGYDHWAESWKWLYAQFTPEKLAPLYYECDRNRNNMAVLGIAYERLKTAILLIVDDPIQAAKWLPEAQMQIEGFEVWAVYPNEFQVWLPLPGGGEKSWGIYAGGGSYHVGTKSYSELANAVKALANSER